MKALLLFSLLILELISMPFFCLDPNVQINNENVSKTQFLPNSDGKGFYSSNTNNLLKITNTLVQLNILVSNSFTSEPIANANVVVYNDSYVTSGLTDSGGNYFVYIEKGFYKFNLSAVGYYNYTTPTNDIDSYSYSFGYPLLPLNGVGIISPNHILENQVYNLVYWSINTTSFLYNFIIYLDSNPLMSTSDTSVFLNPFNAGMYNITVLMNTSIGFFRHQIKLYVIGIIFSNPVNESIVNGGLVLIQFDFKVNDPNNIVIFNSLIATVDGIQYVNTTKSEINSILLPLFENKTSILGFKFVINPLGELNYNLTISVQNVIPALDVSVGDYWQYAIKSINSNTMSGTQSNLYIKVNDKINPFLANISINYTDYDIITNNFIDIMSGWYIVNIVNGFIENSGGNISLPIDTLFLIFTGLNNKYMSASIFNTFDMVTSEVSEGYYDSVKTWIMTPIVSFPPSVTWIEHIAQSNGLIMYLSYYMYSVQITEIKLVKSNYLPVIPNLKYNSLTIEQGSQDKILSWNVEGSGTYKIFKNSSLDQTGSWSTASEVDYNITSFSVGYYNITAIFSNELNISAIYFTELHVLPTITPVITSTITNTLTSTISTTVSTINTDTSYTTSTNIVTTISTILSTIIDTTTKTSTGFTIALLSLSLIGVLIMRRKRNNHDF